MNKKLIIFLLVAFLLVGCNSENKTKENDNSVTSQEENTVATEDVEKDLEKEVENPEVNIDEENEEKADEEEEAEKDSEEDFSTEEELLGEVQLASFIEDGYLDLPEGYIAAVADYYYDFSGELGYFNDLTGGEAIYEDSVECEGDTFVIIPKYYPTTITYQELVWDDENLEVKPVDEGHEITLEDPNYYAINALISEGIPNYRLIIKSGDLEVYWEPGYSGMDGSLILPNELLLIEDPHYPKG